MRGHGAMTRIVLAPCSPFSVSEDLLRESARLARDKGVMLHTHLCETLDEERYTLERFGKRPVEWMENLDWLGPDVWFAHAIHVDDEEIATFARTQCGAAHCPCSNMRLGSGIAPVKKYMAAGVRVGLGVDGSASNDSSNLLLEPRQAMLLAALAARPTAAGGAAQALPAVTVRSDAAGRMDDRARSPRAGDAGRRKGARPRRYRRP